MVNNRFNGLEQKHYEHKMQKMTGRVNVANTGKESLWETGNADTSTVADKAVFQSVGKLNLTSLGPNANQEVKDAWSAALKETGTEGMESSSYLSNLFAIQSEQKNSTGSSDVLGKTTESATAAVKKALTRLNSQSNEKVNAKVQEYRQIERSFYNAFLAAVSQ